MGAKKANEVVETEWNESLTRRTKEFKKKTIIRTEGVSEEFAVEHYLDIKNFMIIDSAI